jgi:hypothetical protein
LPVTFKALIIWHTIVPKGVGSTLASIDKAMLDNDLDASTHPN